MTYTQSFSGTLVAVTCGACGCTFGLDSVHHQKLRETGGTFHCPNGHPRVYRETDVQKVEKMLAAKVAQLDQARADAEWQKRQRQIAERRSAAARGQVTRIKNRVGNGVCPCCNRSFGNLHRHMATKHPGWKKPEDGAA